MNENSPPGSPTPDAAAGSPPASTSGQELHDRLGRLRDLLLEDLVERGVAVRLALLATLAGEHLLLIGPPGTAKSLVARRLRLALSDAAYFERLLTRFTVPEELFGPLSIKGLEQDRYERLIEGYLPSASVAFLDEIFKANSAILNALLTLLNERAFDNGVSRRDVPLAAVVGASNELPEGAELEALFDRFLLRLHVGPVSEAGFGQLLGLRGEAAPQVPEELRLSRQDLAAVQARALTVEVPEDVLGLLSALRQWCLAEGIAVSDRRWRKILKLLQVSALTNGRGSVSVWDGWLLQHCLWNTPEEREKVYRWYEERVGASSAMDPSKLTRVVVHWEQRLESDRASRTQVRDREGRLLYGKHSERTTSTSVAQAMSSSNGEPLFLAPANAKAPQNDFHEEYRDLEERTNDGKGYTARELDQLAMRYRRGYHASLFCHWEGREAYLADTNNRLVKEVELPPLLEPTRHKPEYIDACVGQIRSVHTDVEQYKEGLLAHIASMEAQIKEHLWITPGFAEPARTSLDRTLQEVEGLLVRIGRTEQGFGALPRDEVYPPDVAAPAADESEQGEQAATEDGAGEQAQRATRPGQAAPAQLRPTRSRPRRGRGT